MLQKILLCFTLILCSVFSDYWLLYTHAHGSRRGIGFLLLFVFVCLFFRSISKNPYSYDHQTWHINVPRWVLEIRLFWGQKVKGQGNESEIHCRRGSLHSCECWLLVVIKGSYKRNFTLLLHWIVHTSNGRWRLSSSFVVYNTRICNEPTYVRPSTKRFFDFNEIWNVGRGRRRYAVWPDPRSRSRLRALESWKSFHFQKLSSAPFTIGAGNWPPTLKLGHYVDLFGPDYWYLA